MPLTVHFHLKTPFLKEHLTLNWLLTSPFTIVIKRHSWIAWMVCCQLISSRHLLIPLATFSNALRPLTPGFPTSAIFFFLEGGVSDHVADLSNVLSLGGISVPTAFTTLPSQLSPPPWTCPPAGLLHPWGLKSQPAAYPDHSYWSSCPVTTFFITSAFGCHRLHQFRPLQVD